MLLYTNPSITLKKTFSNKTTAFIVDFLNQLKELAEVTPEDQLLHIYFAE